MTSRMPPKGPSLKKWNFSLFVKIYISQETTGLFPAPTNVPFAYVGSCGGCGKPGCSYTLEGGREKYIYNNMGEN